MDDNPNDLIPKLLDAWCDRREYRALSIVLPAWTAVNGLTDSWGELFAALRHAYAMCNDLPPDERDAIKRAYVAIDVKVLRR